MAKSVLKIVVKKLSSSNWLQRLVPRPPKAPSFVSLLIQPSTAFVSIVHAPASFSLGVRLFSFVHITKQALKTATKSSYSPRPVSHSESSFACSAHSSVHPISTLAMISWHSDLLSWHFILCSSTLFVQHFLP